MVTAVSWLRGRSVDGESYLLIYLEHWSNTLIGGSLEMSRLLLRKAKMLASWGLS
jgi:hypothetical protein